MTQVVNGSAHHAERAGSVGGARAGSATSEHLSSKSPSSSKPRANAFLKRSLDVVVASSVLVVTAPAMAACAIAIHGTMGSPVFFRQMRPGLFGRPFELVKFRTMTNAPEQEGKADLDGARLTQVGRFMRKTSLDELPQLWNVLRGDMSLVGPRPLMMHYLSRYSPEQARRHDVLPGITGWAAVHGRNALSWREKFALDVWYVDHQSFLLDLRILALTALRVARPQGIAYAGFETMPEFMGDEPVAVPA